ncbi:MAG: VanW family protein [Clostridiaceae bacterium]|nr:VanW family protein [Clostridiaceae bacterium]
MKRANTRLTVLFIIGCLIVIGVIVFVGMTSVGILAGNNDKIYDGITVGGVDVGGLTLEEAEQKVETFIENVLQREVTILIDQNEVTATAEELGFSCEEGESVEEAYHLGRDGSLFSRAKAISDMDDSEKSFELTSSVDEAVLTAFVEEHCTQYDVKKKNAKLKLVNGKFKATASRNGKQLQVAETAELISSALQKDISEDPLEVTAVIKTTKAKYTKEQVSKCKDLLASYSTSYASSTTARKNNVKVAADYINGTILYPGKTFSTIKTIKDRTEENGYQSAPEYSSGNVVEGVGGGVCQVSTTLYNAVINAELEIVERAPHSMVVSYVDVSRDAAIAGDYKDFKFKNNTDVPIYIAATADGSTLSFRIYGEETRDSNRTIEFETEILETIQPGDAITTVDVSKPASYRSVTQSAHVGYKAQLWKIVYVDGSESERTQINSSSYSAEPEHVIIGKQSDASASPSPTASAEATEKAKKTTKPKTTKKPSSTKKPSATPKPTSKKDSTKSTAAPSAE